MKKATANMILDDENCNVSSHLTLYCKFQYKKASRENRSNPDWRGEVKLLVYRQQILHVENNDRLYKEVTRTSNT